MFKTLSIVALAAVSTAISPSLTYAQMSNEGGSMSSQGGMGNGDMGSNSMEKGSMGGTSMKKSKMHKKHHSMMKHKAMGDGM